MFNRIRLLTRGFICFALSIFLFIQAAACESEYEYSEKIVKPSIINTYPHESTAFTQGLVYHNGYLYESTGQYGKSSLRKVDLTTGKIEKKHKLSDSYFGEGITILDGRIYQLTWKARKGIIYDAKTFKVLGYFNYPFDGWGITTDGENLIIRNGSQYLFFYDPDNFEFQKRVKVTDRGEPVSLLNELEFIDGKVYSNIWKSDKIISIDPTSGKVTAWYDLSDLRNELNGKHRADVLNGIAYDKENKRIFVTGKLWPKMFEIRVD